MKVYTRKEIRQLISCSNIKQWCEEQGLYYYGIIRFLKGADISVHTYCKILNRLDICSESNHYISTKIMYSDLEEMDRWMKEISFML